MIIFSFLFHNINYINYSLYTGFMGLCIEKEYQSKDVSILTTPKIKIKRSKSEHLNENNVLKIL